MSRDSYESADRDRRDDAGVGPYPEQDRKLVPLRELDHWDVAEGEPDIRGWEVRTLSGRVIGEVGDLLIDTDAREVVMLDIDVEGGHRRTLAPIRAAQVDRTERIVRIDSEDLHIDDLPTVDRKAEPVTETEREVPVEPVSGIPADTATPERQSFRYPTSATEERVIERRPVVVEETVVRRRVVDDAGDASKDEDKRA